MRKETLPIMSTLNDFLKENVPLPDNVFLPLSKRFSGDDGNVLKWEIKAITYAEDEEIRRNCQKKTPVEGRKNDFISELDRIEYILRLTVRCVVFPNLNDAALQNSYGVMGADSLIREMLSPGEFLKLANAVLELNSMAPSFDDELNEANELLEKGDYEAEIAFFCLQKFNILPSQLMSLPRRERAFISAAIERVLAQNGKDG